MIILQRETCCCHSSFIPVLKWIILTLFNWNSLEICKLNYSIKSNIMFSFLFSSLPPASMHAAVLCIRQYPGPMRTSSTRRLTFITTQIRRLCASRTFRPRTRESTNVALISINHRLAIGALMWQFWVSRGRQRKKAYLLFKKKNPCHSPSPSLCSAAHAIDHTGPSWSCCTGSDRWALSRGR